MNRILIISFLLLLGCKSVKKDVSKSSERIQSNKLTTSKKKTDELNNLIQKRNINTAIRVGETKGIIIYPKGTFTIDSDGRFIGQGDSIVMSGNKQTEFQQEESDSTGITTQKNTMDTTATTSSLESEIEKSTKTVSRTPSLIPYIGAAIAIILILAFILKKKPSKPFES